MIVVCVLGIAQIPADSRHIDFIRRYRFNLTAPTRSCSVESQSLAKKN
jgi:hypothetical protein